MKLLMENWRGYLNESVDETGYYILDALEKFKDYARDESRLKQLFQILDSLLGIENPQYEDLKDVHDVLVKEKRTEEGFILAKYLAYKNPKKKQDLTQI